MRLKWPAIIERRAFLSGSCVRTGRVCYVVGFLVLETPGIFHHILAGLALSASFGSVEFVDHAVEAASGAHVQFPDEEEHQSHRCVEEC